MKNIDNLLDTVRKKNASDLHLKVGTRAMIRVNNELIYIDDIGVITDDSIAMLFEEITTEEQRTLFNDTLELDFSYETETVGRFRFSAYRQRGSLYLTCRVIYSEIPTVEELHLPRVCKELALHNNGLVLICGPTGCGKSTTLAAMIGYMNNVSKRKVITIEDPIEYLHEDNLCSFSQREVGADTQSFSIALRHALRQDPDVLLVGEIRDLDSMSNALTAAETGHLVLTTLHTPSVVNAIDRIIDVFPPDQQEQVRIQLADVLKGVIYQKLIPTIDGAGRIVACEIMLNDPAIANLIRTKKSYQIMTAIQNANGSGMQTLDGAIYQLFGDGFIDLEQALANCVDREMLKERLSSKQGLTGSRF